MGYSPTPILEERWLPHLGQVRGRDNHDSQRVRGAIRTGYRNGYRPRQLKTRVGTISLSAPMDHEGAFKTELFERYQRSEKALVGTQMEMYLEGVSTRKVREVTETLCGTSFSATAGSSLDEFDDLVLDTSVN